MSWNDFFKEIENDRKDIRREYDREFGPKRSSQQHSSRSDNSTRQRYATGGNVRKSERLRELAAKGRYGDTEIAEIGPRTARTLDYLIHDGHKEINPRTGLREYPRRKKRKYSPLGQGQGQGQGQGEKQRQKKRTKREDQYRDERRLDEIRRKNLDITVKGPQLPPPSAKEKAIRRKVPKKIEIPSEYADLPKRILDDYREIRNTTNKERRNKKLRKFKEKVKGYRAIPDEPPRPESPLAEYLHGSSFFNDKHIHIADQPINDDYIRKALAKKAIDRKYGKTSKKSTSKSSVLFLRREGEMPLKQHIKSSPVQTGMRTHAVKLKKVKEKNDRLREKALQQGNDLRSVEFLEKPPLYPMTMPITNSNPMNPIYRGATAISGSTTTQNSAGTPDPDIITYYDGNFSMPIGGTLVPIRGTRGTTEGMYLPSHNVGFEGGTRREETVQGGFRNLAGGRRRNLLEEEEES